MLRQTCQRKLLFVILTVGLMQGAYGLEFGLDGGLAGNSNADNWGVGFHGQMIGTTGFGIDAGYEYINSLNYSVNNIALAHSMSQFEVSGLWQGGLRAVRLQLLGGFLLSSKGVQLNGEDILQPLSTGYQIGAGLSVPVATRLRAFGEVGFEGWLNAELPSHMVWRYGLRFLLGDNVVPPILSEEMAREQAQLEEQRELLANPPVTIDSAVPQYIPGRMSQSLPPIVSQAEICKCFPAGPYTLQLGEFGNLAQATRGLEYRGLRQFFNSYSYQRSPQPVFLAQTNPDGPVSLFLGEIPSLEEMDYWRHELRKSGISARQKRIVGNNGERLASVIEDVDVDENNGMATYTAEEVRRMNSLPDDETQSASVSSSTPLPPISPMALNVVDEQEPTDVTALNSAPEAEPMVDAVLQMGPISLSNLQNLLSMDAMKTVLARSATISIPADMKLIWDEGKQEAWLSFSGFSSEQHVDEWQAWYGSEGLLAERVAAAFVPAGDIYSFDLGGKLQEYSVEITRSDSIDTMISSMRSAEVLWFQAFQRINEQPVTVSLNWTPSDSRYRLIVINVTSGEEQQRIWSDLTSVGLLPSLAEQ